MDFRGLEWNVPKDDCVWEYDEFLTNEGGHKLKESNIKILKPDSVLKFGIGNCNRLRGHMPGVVSGNRYTYRVVSKTVDTDKLEIILECRGKVVENGITRNKSKFKFNVNSFLSEKYELVVKLGSVELYRTYPLVVVSRRTEEEKMYWK